MKLPDKVRNSVKCWINVKNNENKCVLSCHIKYLHPSKTHPEILTKGHIKLVNDLDYSDIEFPVSKKLNRKIIFALMYFFMKMIWFIFFIFQIKKLRNV